MARTEKQQEQDGLIRGFHDIPEPAKLRQMTFDELAVLLSSCEAGSPKFLVVEREFKVRLGADQAKINRSNILFGALVTAVIAGVFTILGAWIKSTDHITDRCTEQGAKESALGVKPPVAQIPVNPVQPAAQGKLVPSNPQSNTKPNLSHGKP